MYMPFPWNREKIEMVTIELSNVDVPTFKAFRDPMLHSGCHFGVHVLDLRALLGIWDPLRDLKGTYV